MKLLSVIRLVLSLLVVAWGVAQAEATIPPPTPPATGSTPDGLGSNDYGLE
ncbi:MULTISPECIES: hypothetical protein [unclassified Deinococcus]|uniref:hypothetical protein n=1 Tax=unclassified Deinococcus TaxID=2623546 RepID=UPI001C30997E|nr:MULTISPECIES: hypothetical protein [unclassified Deinococcus]MDK2014637.1 hypothetical protein [Deinococcus sp. 43]